MIGADLPEADLKHYQEAAQVFQEQDLLRMLNTVADLELNIGRVGDPRFWLELTIIKLVKAASTADLQTVIDQLSNVQASSARPSLPRAAERSASVPSPAPRRSLRSPAPAERTPAQEKPAAPETKEAPEPDDDEPAPAVSVDLSTLLNRWEEVVNLVREQKVSVGTFLSEGVPKSLDDDLVLVMFKRHRDFYANRVRRNKDTVEAALKTVFGVQLRIDCKVDYDDLPEEVVKEQRVEEDEHVQMALRIFNGEVVEK